MFKSYQIADIEGLRTDSGKQYLEFLRSEALSMGLYVLQAGEPDLQEPHGEDEVYYVLSGRSRFRAGDEECDVEAGSVLFVAAGVEHRFFDITETLRVLVFFAPPEGAGR